MNMDPKRQSDADAETATLGAGPAVNPPDQEKQVAYTPPQIPDGGLVAWSTVSWTSCENCPGT